MKQVFGSALARRSITIHRRTLLIVSRLRRS
jgi:hypothetical protein